MCQRFGIRQDYTHHLRRHDYKVQSDILQFFRFLIQLAEDFLQLFDLMRENRFLKGTVDVWSLILGFFVFTVADFEYGTVQSLIFALRCTDDPVTDFVGCAIINEFCAGAIDNHFVSSVSSSF